MYVTSDTNLYNGSALDPLLRCMLCFTSMSSESVGTCSRESLLVTPIFVELGLFYVRRMILSSGTMTTGHLLTGEITQ